VQRILFDNFTVEQTKAGVELVNRAMETESSGNITLSTIRDYAMTGIDFISVGAITHSATAMDISLDIDVLS
jgi:nicotinate-nucleotide pyrophosphorylase (carboxylating)